MSSRIAARSMPGVVPKHTGISATCFVIVSPPIPEKRNCCESKLHIQVTGQFFHDSSECVDSHCRTLTSRINHSITTIMTHRKGLHGVITCGSVSEVRPVGLRNFTRLEGLLCNRCSKGLGLLYHWTDASLVEQLVSSTVSGIYIPCIYRKVSPLPQYSMYT